MPDFSLKSAQQLVPPTYDAAAPFKAFDPMAGVEGLVQAIQKLKDDQMKRQEHILKLEEIKRTAEEKRKKGQVEEALRAELAPIFAGPGTDAEKKAKAEQLFMGRGQMPPWYGADTRMGIAEKQIESREKINTEKLIQGAQLAREKMNLTARVETLKGALSKERNVTARANLEQRIKEGEMRMQELGLRERQFVAGLDNPTRETLGKMGVGMGEDRQTFDIQMPGIAPALPVNEPAPAPTMPPQDSLPPLPNQMGEPAPVTPGLPPSAAVPVTPDSVAHLYPEGTKPETLRGAIAAEKQQAQKFKFDFEKMKQGWREEQGKLKEEARLAAEERRVRFKNAGDFEKAYGDAQNDILTTDLRLERTIPEWEGMMANNNGVLPEEEAGKMINMLYALAKERDKKTGVRMPEIYLNSEYQSLHNQVWSAINRLEGVPITQSGLESVKRAWQDLQAQQRALVEAARKRFDEKIQSVYPDNAPASGSTRVIRAIKGPDGKWQVSK